MNKRTECVEISWIINRHWWGGGSFSTRILLSH